MTVRNNEAHFSTAIWHSASKGAYRKGTQVFFSQQAPRLKMWKATYSVSDGCLLSRWNNMKYGCLSLPVANPSNRHICVHVYWASAWAPSASQPLWMWLGWLIRLERYEEILIGPVSINLKISSPPIYVISLLSQSILHTFMVSVV